MSRSRVVPTARTTRARRPSSPSCSSRDLPRARLRRCGVGSLPERDEERRREGVAGAERRGALDAVAVLQTDELEAVLETRHRRRLLAGGEDDPSVEVEPREPWRGEVDRG